MSTDSTTGDTFYNFIRGSLIPNMLPFPNPKSILVLDNCSIHHVEFVTDLLEDAGILHILLPPYSPDLHDSNLAF